MTYSRSASRAKHRRLPQQAWALEPRMMFDAAAVATAEAVVAATDSAPGVTASGAEATIGIDDGSAAQSVDLFSGVTVFTDGAGQELTDLTITVSSSGSNQALVIDGSAIVLQATTTPGTTADNGYTYSVSVSGDSTTITLSIASSGTDAGYTAAGAASLIDGIAYRTLDDTVESGTVTVTLESLSDDGGDTAQLGISSTIAITSNINVAPVIADNGALEAAESFTIDDLGDSTEVVYSSDGSYAYAAGDGAISVFSVDDTGRLTLAQTLTGITDLGSVSEMAISADGRSIYAIDGGGSVYVFSVADDGALSFVSAVDTGNGDASGGLAISEDGAWVYVGTQWNGVARFSRDLSTGALTYVDRVPGEDGSIYSNSRNGVIATAGDYLYVIYTSGSHAILVYQLNDDGTLSTVATLLTGDSGYSAVDYSLAVSDDGQNLYVANPDTGGVAIYQFSGSALTRLSTLTVDGVASIALSDDGSQLYAAAYDGTIGIYTVAGNGTLTLSGSLAGGTGGSDIAVSGDGLSILVAGGGVSRYSGAQTLVLGEALTFAGGLTLKDSNYDALSGGAGNYNGASLSVSASVEGGSFGFADGGGLSYANGVISLDGSAIATLGVSGGVLSVTFTADASTAVANQVLRQLTYSNASATAGSFIQLSVIASDAALAGSAVALTLRVNAVPQVNTDAATGYVLDGATSETAYSFTLFAGLFGDADGDNLNWSVDGLPDGLTFDAATRTISGAATETGAFSLTVTVTDASGASASLALDLAVEQIANRAPAVNEDAATTLDPATEDRVYSTTLDPDLFSDADSVYNGDSLSWSVSGLPDGLTFDAATLTLSGTSGTVGDYTVIVTATDQSGASASAELTLRVITTVEADNSAPALTADASTLTYSSDGSLSGFSKYVNSITLSGDGGTLLIAASDNNNGNGTSYLYVYSRDTASGELTLVQTFTQGTTDDGDASNGIELDGLSGITSVAYSSDGSLLYLSGYSSTGSASTYSISVFSVGDDGALVLVGQVADIAEKVLQIAVAENSGTLYALSASTVYAYSTDGDGALTAIGAYTPDNGFGTAVAMQIDDDGTVYVLSGGRLTIYTAAAADGGLDYAGQLTRSGTTLTWTEADGTAATAGAVSNGNAFNGANAFVVSDAGYIYLTTSNGFLTTLQYDSATNTLTLTNAQDAFSPLGQYPHGIAISGDGTTLYVGSAASTKMAIYTVGEDGVPTLSNTVTMASAVSRLVVSDDGRFIYGGKNLYFSPGLSMVGASGMSVAYSELGTITPAASITLSDSDYDALNGGSGNYNGATITLVRADGANADDTYGFTDANGLTLADGVIYLDGSAIANVANADGTLTITFTADVSTATANRVLQQITYSNASSNPGGSITLRLSVTDRYSAGSTDIQLAVTQINDAPVLEASGQDVTYTSGGNGVKLFKDIAVSAGEDDQAISSLTLTVSGLADAAREVLVIGGSYVTLVDGANVSGSVSVDVVESDGSINTYSYSVTASVSVTDGVATVTVSSNGGLPAELATTLVKNIAYINTSASYSADPTVGDRVIALTAIQDNGGTSDGGIDTTALSISSTVTVSLINAAPTVTATDAEARYVENGDAAALFNQVAVSTGEPGQAITNVELTVSGLSDGASEVLVIDGVSVPLTAEASGETANGYIYYVSLEGDAATVYLYSSDGIAAADAAALIAGLAYANLSDDPTAGTRTVTLTSIQDDGGTANGGADTALLAIAASVTVAAVNDAPIVSATAAQVIYATSGSSAALFSEVAISTVESAQTLSAIAFTVSGLLDGGSETLIVSGTRIALVDGSGTLGNGYAYTVTLDGDSATVTLTSADGIAAADAVTLIEQTSYANLSNAQSAGERIISLSLRDSGGQDDGGFDTTTLEALASIDVVNNSAPELGASADYTSLEAAASLTAISGLADIAAGTLTAGGDYLYVIDSSGNIAIFSRNTNTGELALLQTQESGVLSASRIEVSGDGGTVYILGAGGDSVTLFSRDGADGGLTLLQTLTTENVVDLTMSADGGALYVVDGNYSGLLVYSRDADSGQYALSQSISASTDSEPYLFTAVGIEVVGDYVYVVTDPAAESVANTLIVYQRAADGTLGAVAWLRDGADAGESAVDMPSPLAVSVASDGGTIYVASENGVAAFSFDAASGALSYLGAVGGLSGVTDIALSSDDDTLYLTHADGSLSRYNADGGALTLVDTFTGVDVAALAGALNVATGAHGAVAVIGGGGVVSLKDTLTEIAIDYTEQGTVLLAGVITLSDADYDALADGAGNYNGAVITLARDGGASGDDGYGFVDGNGLTLADGTLYLDGAAIAAFTDDDGTLTLTFTADVTTAVANRVLQQINYTNASDDPDAGVSLRLTVTDVYGASGSVTLALSVAEINDAPLLSAAAANAVYTEGGDAAVLFSDAVVSPVEAGQTISALTLSVSGLSDGSNETLTIDGTVIALVAGSGVTANGYAYSVSVNDGIASVVIAGESGISAADTAALVNSLAYANASDDPTVGTRAVTLTAIQDNGGTADGGADTTTLAVSATVAVAAVNNAPTLTAIPADTGYTEGDNAVGLFSETLISTVESGQAIASLTLTVSGVSDGSSETLTVDGTVIALVAGSGVTANGYAYGVSLSDGSATVVISSTAGIAVADAASLVDGLAYANTSEDPTAGARTVTLSAIQDNGGGPDGTALAIAATVSVVAVNDAPTLTTTPADATYAASGDAAPLFGDTAVSTPEAGQSIAALTLTVSGVVDAVERLNIDGSWVTLADGVSVTTASGLSVTVALDEGTATLVIASGDGLGAAAAQTLIDGLTYANASGAVSGGERIVSLIAVRDNGGAEAGGQDTSALSIAATVNVVNSAPQATDAEIALPAATRGVEYLVTLPDELFTDADGDSLSWSIEGLPDGLSFDADTLTISGTPLATGSVQLVLTARDALGAAASREISLLVNQHSASPVVLPEFDAFGMMASWREDLERRDAPRTEGFARPAARPTPSASGPAAETAPPAGDALSTSNYPLVNGKMDYAATPWQLDPIMETLMPELEKVDFSATRGANAAAENVPSGLRSPLAEGVEGKAAFSAQLQQEQAGFDQLLAALNQLAEKNASPAE